MGIGHSNLTPLTDVNVRFAIFPMILTMVLCSRSWKSSLLAPFMIILYHVLVTIGADVQNPLDNFVGLNAFDANRILNIVQVTLCVVFSQLGWAWFRVLDIQEWFPLRRKIPSIFPTTSHTQVVFNPTNKEYDVGDVPDKEARPHMRWGLKKTSPGWAYLAVTFVYIFGAICGSQIVYDQYIRRTGKDVMAFLTLLIVPLGSGALYLAYCYFRPDPYIVGGTKAYLNSKSSLYGFSDEQIDTLSKAAQSRVIWSIVPVVLFHFIGNLALGAAREFFPSADTNWLSSVGLFTGYFLLLIAVYIGIKVRASGTKQGKTKMDDSGNYYEDVASSYPLSSSSSSSGVKGVDALTAYMMKGKVQ